MAIAQHLLCPAVVMVKINFERLPTKRRSARYACCSWLSARVDDPLKARNDPYIWPDFLGTDTDPEQSLEKLSIPGLWIFGANDGSIPVDLSILRLDGLRKQGLRCEYVLFSGLGHNNMGEALSTATAWIKRRAADG